MIAGSQDAGILLNIILTGRIRWLWVVRHDIPKNDLTFSLPADVLWGSFVTYSFVPTVRGGEMNS